MGSTLRLLLDTHAIYWVLFEPSRIHPKTASIIKRCEDSYVSLVSFWEIAIKVRAGKLDAADMISKGPADLQRLGFKFLGIEYDHVAGTLQLPLYHRDPFDRLLISQAKAENLEIVSNDEVFDRYDVRRHW